MPAVKVVEMQSKSLLNRVHGSYLPFRWSVNPYRGCVHACVYCYARRYHEYLDMDPGAGFERQVFVKVNAVAVLRRELARPGWRRENVAIGTAVDAYQPVEGKYRLTRGILEAFADFHTPCNLMTKNTMVVRDVDVLRALAQGPGVKVGFSVTTLDPELARRIEPDTPPPHQRLKALERLAAAGIHAGVLLAPVLPGLNDDDASLRAVVRAAADHGARFLTSGVLRLQDGVRSVYGDFLRRDAPGLLPLYRRLYPGSYAPRGYQDRIYARIAELKELYGFADASRPLAAGGAAGAAEAGRRGAAAEAGKIRATRETNPAPTAAAGAKRFPVLPGQLTLF